MTPSEQGMLLLCCPLPGDEVRPLTLPQMRNLSLRANAIGLGSGDPMARLRPEDLRRLGYDDAMCQRICSLLDREVRLEQYLQTGFDRGAVPITRLSPSYPARLHEQLGMNCPPVLFAMGDQSLLQTRCISVVGSRELEPVGVKFARTVGRLAAREDRTLVSGNAGGADRTAQAACLEAGGRVICFVADELQRQTPQRGTLLLSEAGYDLPFSAARAYSRNRLIHTMGERCFVVRCTSGSGGTWQGTTENLRRGWSEVYVCDDGSDGARNLQARGATLLRTESLTSLDDAMPDQQCLF